MKLAIEMKGLDDVVARVRGLSDNKMQSAIARGMTLTAVDVRDALVRSMQQDLDRPTPYALKSLAVEAASNSLGTAGWKNIPRNGDALDGKQVSSRFMQASVFVKDDSTKKGTPATKFLLPQVEGGARHVKRFERALQAKGSMPQGWQAVPAKGAKLDAYGNVSAGQIIQILSQVGAELVAGFNRGIVGPKDGRKGAQNKRRQALGRAGGQYVAVPTRKGKLQPGIYLAEGKDFGAKLGYGRTGKLVPVFIFTKGTTYKRRFDFYGQAQRLAGQRLGPNVQRAISDRIAALQAQGARA